MSPKLLSSDIAESLKRDVRTGLISGGENPQPTKRVPVTFLELSFSVLSSLKIDRLLSKSPGHVIKGPSLSVAFNLERTIWEFFLHDSWEEGDFSVR